MKKIVSSAALALLLTAFLGGSVHAQTMPTLYNQSGTEVSGFDSSTNALTPGWYYNQSGSPLYYYANGTYYDPSTQSYGGSVVYPNADGPTMSASGTFTPSAPNTGLGGSALYVWLALLASAGIAVAGAHYLTREKPLS